MVSGTHCSVAAFLSSQLPTDKFKKVFAAQGVSLSEDNVTALAQFYDRDHVGKVYFQDFCTDVRALVCGSMPCSVHAV